MDLQVTLTVVEGKDEGKTFKLSAERAMIGRKSADLALTDAKVSQIHAAIEVSGTDVYAVDLGAKNGLFVNGERIGRAKLKNMDVIALGATKIRVMMVENLEAFRRRNAAPEDSEETTGSKDIGTLIDDELKRFSKWDLSPSAEGVEGESGFVMGGVRYGIEVLEGPDAGRRIRLSKPSTTIGRGNTDIVLHDVDVSRLHGRIDVLPDGKVVIRDLGSSNGTFLKDERVTEATWSEGDLVRLGRTLLRLVSRST